MCSDRERVCGEVEIGSVREKRKRGRDSEPGSHKSYLLN